MRPDYLETTSYFQNWSAYYVRAPKPMNNKSLSWSICSPLLITVHGTTLFRSMCAAQLACGTRHHKRPIPMRAWPLPNRHAPCGTKASRVSHFHACPTAAQSAYGTKGSQVSHPESQQASSDQTSFFFCLCVYHLWMESISNSRMFWVYSSLNQRMWWSSLQSSTEPLAIFNK